VDVADPREVHDVARRGIAGANPYGFGFALGGLAVGFALSALAVGAYMAASGLRHDSGGFGGDLVSLAGLWLGLAGAAVLAVRSRPNRTRQHIFAALGQEYGLAIRLWPDLPCGIAFGVAAQFLLVGLLELPLLPFVPHLYHRLDEPARSLVANVHGPGLIVLGVFICVGSPLVEELFFRGLLLRSLIAGCASFLARAAIPTAVVVVGIVFGLVHFEALELPALAGFGILLGAIATRTGRLGTGIFAHATFNAAAFISLAAIHFP
jgi:hypothetical protein